MYFRSWAGLSELMVHSRLTSCTPIVPTYSIAKGKVSTAAHRDVVAEYNRMLSDMVPG